jgi:hypothetical protein
MKTVLTGLCAALLLSACASDYGTLGNRSGGSNVEMGGKITGGITTGTTKVSTGGATYNVNTTGVGGGNSTLHIGGH